MATKLYNATKNVLNNYNLTFNTPTPKQLQLYNNCVAKNGWWWAKRLVAVCGGYYVIYSSGGNGYVATRIYANKVSQKWGSHSYILHAYGPHTMCYAIAQNIAKNAMYRTTHTSKIQQWLTTPHTTHRTTPYNPYT